jgi:hypothetical protein
MQPRPASRIVPAAFAMAALLCLAPRTAWGAELTFKPDGRWAVEINGERSWDAKVLEGGAQGKYLLDLASEKQVLLVDVSARSATIVPKEDVRRSDDGTVRIDDRFAWSAPGYLLAIKGKTLRFQTETSDVVIRETSKTEEAKGHASADTATETAPTTPAAGRASSGEVAVGAASTAPAGRPVAFECVALTTRPAAGIPGCTQFVYIRNTCEVPVLAQVQRTEHLMTGTLPQAFSQTVPPGEQWLGCAWWSGATAPAQHEILGAVFLSEPPAPPPAKRKSSGRP